MCVAHGGAEEGGGGAHGGDAPARMGEWDLAGELHGDVRKVVVGSIWGDEGRRRGLHGELGGGGVHGEWQQHSGTWASVAWEWVGRGAARR